MNTKLIAIILSASLLCSCGLARKKEPVPAPVSIKTELSQIEIDINARAYKKALRRLNAITEQYSQTDAADDAYILMGRAHCLNNDFNKCYRAYISVINSEFFSPREVDASIGASRALIKLGRYDEALSLSQRALKVGNTSKQTKLEIYQLRYDVLRNTGDRLESLKVLAWLSQNVESEKLRKKYEIRAVEIVESNLKDDELKSVADDSSFGPYRHVALYKVGVAYFEQRDYSRAESYLERLKSMAPESDLATEATTIIEQIEARRRVKPLVIGAVLPLTGRYKNVGYKSLRGLQLGLGVVGPDNSRFKLAIIDSAGNPDTARRAVERLVVEDSAIAIVGDIVSRTAEAVAQKSDELGIPNIALSQKSGLTEIGSYVFRNALTSRAIVTELVRSAMDDHGLKKFAVFYPNDPYGVEYANLFWDEVLKRGGEIRAAQSYPAKSPDLRGPIKRAVGTFYLEDREQELHTLLKDWYAEQKVINSRTSAPDDILKPVVDFDAVFIPDSINNMAQVASMMLFNDIDGVRLLGTNLWNSKELAKRGTKLIEDSLFVDAETSLQGGLNKTDFERKFRAVFGQKPSVFEAQAYDTGLALRQLIVSGNRSRVGLREAISELSSFSGAVGKIQVDQNREFSRPLAVLSVVDGKISAPRKIPETQTD